MSFPMPIYRVLLTIWQVLTLALIGWWFIAGERDSIHWIWIMLFLTPILVLAATLAPISSKRRSLLYWLLAAFTVPTAGAGLTSLAGWMFVVTVVLLIWAARRENPNREMVQA